MMVPPTESLATLLICTAVALAATFAWYLITWLAFNDPLN
jgi:hypothetical protein